MKKIICALICVLTLCSCSSFKDVRVVNKGIDFKAHIFYLSKEYFLSVSMENDGTACFTVTEDKLNSFNVCICNNKVTFCCNGIECEQDVSAVKNSVYTVVYTVFAYFDQYDYKAEKRDGNYFVKGDTSLFDFELLVSPAGLPISAEGEDFSANFYDVTLKNNK